MISQQQLIAKLQTLKQIKPNQDWVVLSKSRILSSPAVPARKAALTSVFKAFYQPKLAYSLAVLMLVFLGVAGVKYGAPHSSDPTVAVKQSTKTAVNLVADNALKTSVEAFKEKSQNLAQAIQAHSDNKSMAVSEVNTAAKTLASDIEKNPQLAKTVALDVNNNKNLLDIPGGGGVKDTSDALYKTIDDQLVKDLENSSLTADQQKALIEALKYMAAGKYSDALAQMLLIK